MKKVAIAMAFSLTFIASCKNEKRQVETNAAEETKDISVEENLQMKLDNGEKWMANKETQLGVEKMDSIITAFKSSENKDYQSLGENLSLQTSYVVKNCTMQGESHDQLHVVLVPMLDEISVLKETNETAISQKALSHLEQLISSYFSHFKL